MISLSEWVLQIQLQSVDRKGVPNLQSGSVFYGISCCDICQTVSSALLWPYFMKLFDLLTIGSWENKGVPDHKVQAVADLFSIKSYYLTDPNIDDDQFRYLVLLHKDADMQNLTSIFDNIAEFIDNNGIENIVMSGNVIPEKFSIINKNYSNFSQMLPKLPPYITEKVELIFNHLNQNINDLFNVLKAIVEDGVQNTPEQLRKVNNQIDKIKTDFRSDLRGLYLNQNPTNID